MYVSWPCDSTCSLFIFYCLTLSRVEADTPPHEGPAFIVFYCKLLQIFSLFCFICKRKNPTVTMKKSGTMVTVEQQCPSCGDQSFRWSSQPLILGKFPAGNILLSFAVLMAGASISKVLLVFKHLGLAAYTARTFFNHQKMFLFPVILQYWETYRASLVTKLKDMTNVAWSGDGRFDSMGHSAKYSAYTMFCPTIMKVVHFELLQVNYCTVCWVQHIVVRNTNISLHEWSLCLFPCVFFP